MNRWYGIDYIDIVKSPFQYLCRLFYANDNNKSEIKYFPLNKVIARDFIKERKNKYSGKVDRTVYLRINYILTGLIVERKKKYGVVKKCLEAKIKSVEVYGNKNGYSDDLGVLKL